MRLTGDLIEDYHIMGYVWQLSHFLHNYDIFRLDSKKLTLVAILFPDGNLTRSWQKAVYQLCVALRMRYHSCSTENYTSDLNLWLDVGEIGYVGHDLSAMCS